MTLNPAATALTTLLCERSPTLGVFWPAGWPTTTAAVDTLRALIEAGAQYVEVGAGTATRPVGHSALADAITTVSAIARPTGVPVAVRAPWDALARVGPVAAAAALARAGAGAVVIPDLPERSVELWAAAARGAGLHAPRVAFHRSTDARLGTVCRAASGWVFTPATDTPTGFPGGPDLAGLRTFMPRLRSTTRLPVVIGAGRCSVARAVRVSRFADAVLVGSPLIQRVQATPGPDGRTHAAAYVTELAAAFQAEHAALTELTGTVRGRPARRS
jgi:tryptophan synthase alpha chain